MSTITVGLNVTGSGGFILPLFQYSHPDGDATAEVAALNAAGTTTATVQGVLAAPIGGQNYGVLSVSIVSFADDNNPRLIALATGAIYQEPMYRVSMANWHQIAPSGTDTATGTLVATTP